MQKIVKIAQREYLETVKARTFIFSVVFTPTLIIGMIFFVGRLQKAVVAPGGNKRVAVVDLTGQLGGDLGQVFADDNASSPGRRIFLSYYQSGENADDLVTKLTGQVLASRSDAYVVISQDVIDGHGNIRYFTQNPADIELPDKVGSLVNKAIRDHRLRRHNLAPELIAELSQSVPVKLVDVKSEQVTDAGTMMMPFFFLFLMYAAVFGTSQWMLTSVLEEKNTRTIEVLLSAVSPLELMAGKIVGLSAVGLTLVAVWGTAGWVSASWQGISGMVTADTIGFFAIYYVLGFLLISSILAAIGSACNTLKEAQSLMSPITMLLIIPLMAWFYIARYPDSNISLIMSFIPPITPMVMIVRIASGSPLPMAQIVATMALLLASVPVVMWASAKIFRTGILMYGKPPSLGELVRWLRYK